MATFRKSKKVGPLRVTLSPRGVSTSAGVPGMRVSANSRGEVRRTLSVPGTGVYDTKKVGGGKTRKGKPTQAEVDLELDQIVAQLIHGLEPEMQRTAYEMFRADPNEAMAQMAHDLEAAGWEPETVHRIMPALRR